MHETEKAIRKPSFSDLASAPEEDAILTPPRKNKQRQAFHFAWLPGIFLRPAKTIRAILADEKPNWPGLFSSKGKIREIGLWISNDLYKQPLTQLELENLKRMIFQNT